MELGAIIQEYLKYGMGGQLAERQVQEHARQMLSALVKREGTGCRHKGDTCLFRTGRPGA